MTTADSPPVLGRATLAEPSSIGSAKSATSNGAASNAGCRLLWRGRLATGTSHFLDGSSLRLAEVEIWLMSLTAPWPPFADPTRRGWSILGIAIVAHLFAVASISPTTTMSRARSASFVEDPFAAHPSTSATSVADLCLGLEMMRGSDIRIVGSSIKVIPTGSSPLVARPSSTYKGKGREDVETVMVETPTDVRVYIDPRCPETVVWFQDTFCRVGCEGIGVKLDAGGEEVIVYASSLPVIEANNAASSSSLATVQPPAITLSLGRAVKLGARPPRPDDPMPRENLFTKKLRRTASLPVLDFDASSKSTTNPLARFSSLSSIKEQPILDPRSRKLTTATSSKSLSNLLSTEAATLSRRTLHRSTSSRDPFGASTGPVGSIPQPSRRSSSILLPTRSQHLPLKRSRSSTSTTVRMIDSPPSSPTSEASATRKRSTSLVPPGPTSPTPSILSNNAFEEEEEEDQVGELARRKRVSGAEREEGGKRKGMTRCESAPAGVFKMAAAAGVKGERSSRERSASLAPAAEGVEARNKSTIRKLLLSRLTTRGLTRDDQRFTDIFSITLRGVQFALRETFKSTLLDRTHATDLIDRHLDMYINSRSSSSTSSLIQVKEEDSNEFVSLLKSKSTTPMTMPSPQSLEAMEVD